MFPLFRKRTLWLPTWQSALIAATACGLLVWFILANIHPFLAVTEPVEDARLLVIEGWVPDHVIETHLSSGKDYDLICTTGEPLPRGSYLSEHKTFAELTAKTLQALGVSAEKIISAPSGKNIRDRTYNSALAFREKRIHSPNQLLREAKAIDILTEGVHGHRTRTVFRKVLGDHVEIGIISPASENYDPDRWFLSSEGVKAVIIESISVAYEWLGKTDR